MARICQGWREVDLSYLAVPGKHPHQDELRERAMGRRFLERHRLAAFYLVSLAIVCAIMAVAVVSGATSVVQALLEFLRSEGLYTNTFSIGRFALVQPWGWLILLFAVAPTVSAIVVSLATAGPEGLRSLFGRLKPWCPEADPAEARRAWLILLGAGAIGTSAYLAVALFISSPESRTHVFHVLGTAPAAILFFLIVGPFIDEGGLLEELGWRGYAQPLLNEGLSGPLKAALLLGVLWWAWHLPREVGTILSGVPLGAFLAGQGVFLLLCMGLSVVITPFWLRTGGSALTGVFVHGITNFWSKALGRPMFELTGTDVRTWAVVVAALAVLVVWGPGLGAPLGRTDQR